MDLPRDRQFPSVNGIYALPAQSDQQYPSMEGSRGPLPAYGRQFPSMADICTCAGPASRQFPSTDGSSARSGPGCPHFPSTDDFRPRSSALARYLRPPADKESPLKPLQGQPPKWSTLKCVVRRRPSLPHGPPCSTIGAEKLNFRVRNGAGCFPLAMITETLLRCVAGGDFSPFFPTVSRELHSGRVASL